MTGLGSVEAALENATEVRIYHSSSANFPNPVFPIEAITAALGVDNIQARGEAVPEGGSTALLLALPMAVFLLAGRRIRALAKCV